MDNENAMVEAEEDMETSQAYNDRKDYQRPPSKLLVKRTNFSSVLLTKRTTKSETVDFDYVTRRR